MRALRRLRGFFAVRRLPGEVPKAILERRPPAAAMPVRRYCGRRFGELPGQRNPTRSARSIVFVVVVLQVHVDAASVPAARVSLGFIRRRRRRVILLLPPWSTAATHIVGETDEIVLGLFCSQPRESNVRPSGVEWRRRLVRRLLVDRRQLPLGHGFRLFLIRLWCRPRVALPVSRARVVPTLEV